MNRYWTTLRTRQGRSWQCLHPDCREADKPGYGCRLASEADADRGARRHLILDHGERP